MGHLYRVSEDAGMLNVSTVARKWIGLGKLEAREEAIRELG